MPSRPAWNKKLSKRWDNPEASIGKKIRELKSGRLTAWFAIGPAQAIFEEKLFPELNVLLYNLVIQDADLYLRIYMVGPRLEDASPIIMVCCRDPSIRKDAMKSIRGHKLLEQYPGIGLGANDTPLEQLVPAVPLMDEEQVVDEEDEDAPAIDERIRIFASPTLVPIGRQLFAKDDSDHKYIRSATGGPIIRIGTKYYQLTVGHICHPKEDIVTVAEAGLPSDECEIDGWSDEDNNESDLEVLSEATSLGSYTPDEALSDTESVGYRSIETASISNPHGDHKDYPSESPSPSGSMNDMGEMTPSFHALPDDLTQIGSISVRSAKTQDPSLDYTLVHIEGFPGHELTNEVCLGCQPGNSDRRLYIEEVADIGADETPVVAVTASRGALRGTLLPGATYLRRKGTSSFQKIYTLQLNATVVEGDSGSAVINVDTGDLYGHIILGSPTTELAYIIAAVDIFRDIHVGTGMQAQLCSGDVSQRKEPTLASLFIGPFSQDGQTCSHQEVMEKRRILIGAEDPDTLTGMGPHLASDSGGPSQPRSAVSDGLISTSWVVDAILKGDMSALKAFLSHDVDIEERASGHHQETPLKERPLIHAIQKQSADAVEILLSSREDVDIESPNKGGNTPLFCAIAEGDSKIVEHLIKAHVNVDAPSTGGLTPLMKATIEGHLEIVCTLLDSGADYRAYSDDGFTCVHYIVQARRAGAELIGEFRRRQIPLDIQRRGHGETALSTLLRYYNHRESEEWMRKFDALMTPPVNVNLEDKDGMTPLFHAVLRNLHEPTLKLVKLNAKYGSKRLNKDSWCPTDNMRRLMMDYPQLQPLRHRSSWWYI